MNPSDYEAKIALGRSEYEGHIAVWRAAIYNRSKEIDPNKVEDWHSLCLGFFLGRGLTLGLSSELANFIRYHTELG